MRPFSCSQCGQTVFFENTACTHCGAVLAYLPSTREILSFTVDQANGENWVIKGAASHLSLRPCDNRRKYGFCNWLRDADDDTELCSSCALTTIIPDLDVPGHMQAWQTIEQAKKRLIYTLDSLGLMPERKSSPGDLRGLEFQLLANTPGEAPVLTGHANGVITLNIDEADDVKREAARVALDEPVRTTLGHLRHEISHYLQFRWIENTPAMEQCRAVFGDERADYAQALERHRNQGAPEDWQLHFISAYASSHPWEDWAETCAHALLITDAVNTAAAWGLQLNSRAAQTSPAVNADGAPLAQLVLSQWLPVAQFLNAMNRSLGLRDGYPFLMPDKVLNKMNTVQSLLQAAAASRKTAG